MKALLSFSGQGEQNAGWVDADFKTPWPSLRMVTHNKDELGVQVSLANVRKMGDLTNQSCQNADGEQ